jgi:hypothetical protein
MFRAKWSSRIEILGAAVIVAVLVFSASCRRDANQDGTPATTSATASGAALAATGDHSNDEFCRTIVLQGEKFALFTKFDPLDLAKRAKYFADQKELNATLVKTAPTSLASDVALQTRNSNAMMDAQMGNHSPSIMANARLLSSPKNLAASRHMADYCGVTVSR